MFGRRIFLIALLLCCLPAHVNALTVVPNYDASVISLPYFSQVQSAVNYAIQQFAGRFSDPIAIRVDVVATAGPSDPQSPGLAANVANIYTGLTYFGVRNALVSHATTANDSVANASLSATTDPTGGNDFALTVAEARTLGFLPANDPAQSAGTIYFDSTASYSFDPI